MRRVGMMLCAAALGLAVVAGCSGDEEPTAETTQDTTETQTEQTEESGSEGDTGQETEASGDESASEYCKQASEAGQKILNPDATSADFVQVYRDIAEVAPADIKADWTKVADSLETLQKAQEEMSNPDTSDPEAAMKELEEATKEMEKVSTDLEASTNAISKDLTDRCGAVSGG